MPSTPEQSDDELKRVADESELMVLLQSHHNKGVIAHGDSTP